MIIVGLRAFRKTLGGVTQGVRVCRGHCPSPATCRGSEQREPANCQLEALAGLLLACVILGAAEVAVGVNSSLTVFASVALDQRPLQSAEDSGLTPKPVLDDRVREAPQRRAASVRPDH